MAAGYFMIATFARTPMMLYALMAVVGIGWSAIVSLPFAIMSDKVDKSRMGFFMGVFNLSVVLPQLMSTGVGYGLKSAGNNSLLYVFCGGSLAISAALWCLVKDKQGSAIASGAPSAAH